jgi:hypothetical protein
MHGKALLIVSSSLLAILVVTACSAVVNGSGNLVAETREVSGFDRIDLEVPGDLTIIQGAGESLTIETDDNVMKHVQTEVRGGTLYLSFKRGYSLTDPTRLAFTVGVDDLSGVSVSGSGGIDAERLATDGLEIDVSGSGTVRIGNLTAESLTMSISGSGEVDLAGEVATQNIDISGSGEYQAGDLASESIEIDISGSGNATVWASEILDTSVSGSGTVNYYGRPAVNSSDSGSGEITGLGEK